MLGAIHEATAATVLTVAAADELASSCTSSGFGQARGTAGSLLSGEATGELDWEILPSVSVSRELVSAFSTSSLSAAALSVEALCPMPHYCEGDASLCQKRCTGERVPADDWTYYSIVAGSRVGLDADKLAIGVILKIALKVFQKSFEGDKTSACLAPLVGSQAPN